jgi:predicted acylesterase/phospholipase RssA
MSKEMKEEMKALREKQVKPYTNLVLSGGGVKGTQAIGFCAAMKEEGILKDIKEIAGSSAGALLASMVAAGCDPEDIKNKLRDKNLREFGKGGIAKTLGRDNLPLRQFLNDEIRNSFQETLNSQDFIAKFDDFLRNSDESDRLKSNIKMNSLKERLANPKKVVTFADLDLMNKIDPEKFKKLHLTATEILTDATEVTIFNAANSPDVSIAKAAGASGALPAFFKPVTINGKQYSDGGVMDNTPTRYFDDKDGRTLVVMYMDNKEKSNFQAIHSEKAIKPAGSNRIGRWALDSFVSQAVGQKENYSKLDAITRQDIRDNHALDTVVLDSKDVGVADFNITPQKFDTLFNDGKMAMKQHLLNMDPYMDPFPDYDKSKYKDIEQFVKIFNAVSSSDKVSALNLNEAQKDFMEDVSALDPQVWGDVLQAADERKDPSAAPVKEQKRTNRQWNAVLYEPMANLVADYVQNISQNDKTTAKDLRANLKDTAHELSKAGEIDMAAADNMNFIVDKSQYIKPPEKIAAIAQTPEEITAIVDPSQGAKGKKDFAAITEQIDLKKLKHLVKIDQPAIESKDVARSSGKKHEPKRVTKKDSIAR